ncbi:2TM domain-containing protein [Zobellia uliginosa]|uniref:2TM domain-containing protein n=1 Tax=Zobellia uliginosa TaxID=143224 RepID=UPI001C066C63|nr:2TM domain-containing protein [Zobellia uliginosa]MBU2945950.1 2TM domain-containing protein [Zobellia uliginosa]
MEGNKILKELLWGFIIGNLVFFGFITYSYFLDEQRFELIYEDIWREYFTNIVFSIILYLVNMSWFYFLLKKYERNIYTVKRMALAVFGNVVITCMGVFVAISIIATTLYDIPFEEVMGVHTVENYVRSVFISLGVSLIFYAIFYYRYRQENKVKEQKIIANTASAKFDALKNQLDPHFLFNSLNVLSSLIEEDPYQAQKFTSSLSKVYRYVLEQKSKDLVLVDEELQFAKTYVRLLKMRFEDSIVFDIIEKSADPEAKIVPLSLQLLIENAVKHNVVTSSKPLKLQVYEQGGELVVVNNLQEKQVVKKSSGVGLYNIRERYALLTHRKVQIDKTATDFSVRLPILLKQISAMEIQHEYIEDKRYKKAKEKVEAIKGFYGNLLAYCIVIPCLAFLNYRTTSFPWVIFPILGWGFGILMHAMEAFGTNPLWGRRWEEKKMQEYMDDENF